MKNKKKMFSIGIGLLLLINTMVILISIPVKADASSELGIVAPSGTIEVGDTFSTVVYFDPGDDVFSTWKVYSLLYNNTNSGILNITGVTLGTGWGSFGDIGSYDNDTGVLTNTQSFSMSNVETNSTLFTINWEAVGVGTINIEFNETAIAKTPEEYITYDIKNISFDVYPKQPASLSASMFNYTAINLSFNPGAGGTYTTVCGKAGSYPSNPQDSVIYNGTLTEFDHEGLDNSTTYYYRAWTWNETNGIHSLYYRQASATTDGPTSFSFSGITPADGSTTANCTYSIPINITVTNTAGSSCSWSITTTNGDSWSGSGLLNASTPVRTMSGLSHNTVYWWNVTVTDGIDDTAYSNNSFTTGVGGGASPVSSTPYPAHGSSNIPINLNTFNVTITDAENDPLEEVRFYWSNGTLIATDTTVSVPGEAEISPVLSLNYNTLYRWYVVMEDSCGTTTSSTYSFTTETRSLSITKEWVAHADNSSIQAWINVTNNGQADLENLVVNDTLDTNVVFSSSSPNEDNTGANWVSWDVATLNSGNSVSIELWLNVTNFLLPTGTTIGNSAKVTHGDQTWTATAPASFTYGMSATKSANITTLEWNTTSVNYTIVITNTGDFALTNVLVNESIPANMTYWTSFGGTPNPAGTQFDLGTINPDNNVTLYVLFNTSYKESGAILINGTRIYNNITAVSDEVAEISLTNHLFVGARTELIRIRYNSYLTNTQDIGETVLNIIGILLIIGSILLIIYVVNKSGFLGGGE